MIQHAGDPRSALLAAWNSGKLVHREAAIRTLPQILPDQKNDVGGLYIGGELPTTVIADAQGNVRRRFVGARSLPVFEAMIKEASQTPS